jgi:pSer/pThr/pTyr-binding forkhead associated (FHA) protein
LIALQVEYLTGPNAGRKMLLRETCVTFGRSAERSLPIDLPFISREHGEFRFDHGRWILINHSNNATFLNGKPVTRKPRPIKGPCTVSIGDHDVFRVEPRNTDTDEPAHVQDNAQADTSNLPNDTASQAPSGKVKLWIGIGVFWLVAFGFIAFATFNRADTSNPSPSDNLPRPITAEQIRAEITAPPDKATPDERQAAQALAQAHEFYALIERRPDALYHAYDAYRTALAYTRGDGLSDPQDKRSFYVLQQRLIQGVTQRYESATQLLKSRQYKAADNAFKDLRAFYPDTDSRVFKDALKREAAARDALEKRRR